MKDAFSNLYDSIVNKNCTFIRLGYGSQLRIGIGEKIYYKHPKLEGKYHGEWDLITRAFTWRISKNNRFLCGSDDEPEDIDKILKTLELGTVSHIEKKNIADISMHLSKGIIIDFFCCSKDDNQMIIMNGIETAYEFTLEGIYEVNTNEHFEKLSEIEAILSELSEACNKRWEEQVPDSGYSKECGDCFYFRGIDGHFYFWEFGICSNCESPYDGMLVGLKSGCQFHKYLKDLLSSK
jgi:flagellin-specific chaperone FliS